MGIRLHSAEQKVIARDTAQNHSFQPVEIVKPIAIGFRHGRQERLTRVLLQKPKQLPQGKSNYLATFLLQGGHIRTDLGSNLQNRLLLWMWITPPNAFATWRPVFGQGDTHLRRGQRTPVLHNLPGVEFREAYFTPTFSKFVNQACAGVEVKVTDQAAFDPIRSAVTMLVEARKVPAFAWRNDGGAVPFWIDKLTGSSRLRTMIDAGAGADEVVGAWRAELDAFDARRRRYLLYSRVGS